MQRAGAEDDAELVGLAKIFYNYSLKGREESRGWYGENTCDELALSRACARLWRVAAPGSALFYTLTDEERRVSSVSALSELLSR